MTVVQKNNSTVATYVYNACDQRIGKMFSAEAKFAGQALRTLFRIF